MGSYTHIFLIVIAFIIHSATNKGKTLIVEGVWSWYYFRTYYVYHLAVFLGNTLNYKKLNSFKVHKHHLQTKRGQISIFFAYSA